VSRRGETSEQANKNKTLARLCQMDGMYRLFSSIISGYIDEHCQLVNM